MDPTATETRNAELTSELAVLRARVAAFEQGKADSHKEDELRRNQRRYELATAAGQVGVWEWNLATNEVHLDPSVKALLGYADHEIGNRMEDWSQCVHPEDREKIGAAKDAYILGKSAQFELERRMLHKDGSVRWFFTRGAALRDHSGSATHIVGTDTDITERKLMEAELRAAQDKLETTLDALPDFLFELDRDGHVLDYRAPDPELLYRPPSEFLGRRMTDILPEPAASTTAASIREALRSGRSKGATYSLQTPRGMRWFELSIVAIGDTESPDCRLITLAREITERRQAEQQLHESKEQFRALFELAPDAICLIDPATGDIAEFNRCAHESLGYTREEFARLGLADIDASETQVEAAARLRRIVSAGSQPFETRHRTKTGELRDVLINPSVIILGGRAFIQAHCRDITELKRTQRALREAAEVRKELERIVSNSPAVAFLWRAVPGWPVEYVTDNVAQFGHTPDDFRSGRITYAEIVHPDDLPRIEAEVARCVEEGCQAFVQEYRILTKEGVVRWLDDRTWVRRDAQGAITHYQGIVLDITERKQAEEELAKFKTISDQAVYGAAIADFDGKVLYLNERFARMHGYAPDELIGRNLSAFHTGAQMPHVNELNARVRKEGGYTGETVWHQRRDGQVFPTLMNATAVRDERGIPMFISATAIDVTEQRKAEEQARRNQAELAHAGRLSTMGEMAAGLAHELNQPLGAITSSASGGLKMLKAGRTDSESLIRIMELALEQAQRAGEIIRRLRDLVRRREPRRSSVNVNETIREAVAFVMHEVRQAEIAITVELDDAASTPISADGIQLQQVVINLLRNAVEAMRTATGQDRRLAIQTALTDDVIEVSVRDRGRGIPPSEIERVFTPFFSTTPEGLGMGLSISRSIAEAHGGRLRAIPNSDRGMTFQFTLPANKGA